MVPNCLDSSYKLANNYTEWYKTLFSVPASAAASSASPVVVVDDDSEAAAEDLSDPPDDSENGEDDASNEGSFNKVLPPLPTKRMEL